VQEQFTGLEGIIEDIQGGLAGWQFFPGEAGDALLFVVHGVTHRPVVRGGFVYMCVYVCMCVCVCVCVCLCERERRDG
jgi:hypothetical protein